MFKLLPAPMVRVPLALIPVDAVLLEISVRLDPDGMVALLLLTEKLPVELLPS